MINTLGIRSFRNLESVDLVPSPTLNFIVGANGSGKTSLLEAIYCLGRGRSFRTTRSDQMILSGSEYFQVTSKISTGSGKTAPLGIERDGRRQRIRFAGENLASTSELVRLLPIQMIHPNSHKLLEEGPKFRRQFLDWGVFHVEHQFFPAWQRYQRALKQRNAALRQYGSRIEKAWEKELLDTGLIIHEHRLAYLDKLQKNLVPYLQPINGEVDLELTYECGWPEGQSLADSLDQCRDVDRKRGFTTAGPHRADIRFVVDGVPATERLSRGQQKLLVSALLLAQAGQFMQETGRTCVILVDDLAAELDENHRRALIKVIRDMSAQAFISLIDPETINAERQEADKMFHVEQGHVKLVV